MARRLSRSILADKPRVTRFPVEFDPVEADMKGDQQGIQQEQQQGGMVFAEGNGNGHVVEEQQQQQQFQQPEQHAMGVQLLGEAGDMDMEA